uniref:Uncharacterized protein n=1 Tax=Tetranychus urticae TaxID=32264 RepID=T1KX28_TETUR
MNEEVGRNSDKIRHSDEDYHDITIDWSNESFDYRKQLFHQLSAFTGIPVEHQEYVSVNNALLRIGGLLNTEWKDKTHMVGYAWQYDTKERAMNTFHDGDCFLFRTKLFGDDAGFGCRYELWHQSLVNETECNRHYCHYLGRRSFTEKLSELMKSDKLQKIFNESVLQFSRQPEILKRVRLNLNINHLTYPLCTAVASEWPNLLRFNANYLRYRG